MKKFTLLCIFILSSISYSSAAGRLDDIEDQLDTMRRRQMINDALSTLESNDFQRQRDEIQRLRHENDSLRLQMLSKSESKVPPKPVRKFGNGNCVAPFNTLEVKRTLKVVNYKDGAYITHSYLVMTEGWIFKKTRIVLAEDYVEKEGSLINENYFLVTCPAHDSVININDYVNKIRQNK